MNPTIATIGHSYIRRLGEYCRTNNLPVNFNISWLNGFLYGKGGLNLTKLTDKLLSVDFFNVVHPDIVILQVGGNDIDSRDFNLIIFMNNFEHLLRILLEQGVQQIIVMKIFHRLVCRTSPALYTARRSQVNFAVSQLVSKSYDSSVVFWNPKRVCQVHCLSGDGIHLPKSKQKAYYYDLKRAVLYVTRRLKN